MRKSRRDVNAEAILKRQVLTERGEWCEVCGWHPPSWRAWLGAMLEMHHITPVAYGGPNTADNVVILCPNHHAMAHEALGQPRRGRKRPTWAGPTTRADVVATLRLIDLDPEAWHKDEATRVANLLAEERPRS